MDQSLIMWRKSCGWLFRAVPCLRRNGEDLRCASKLNASFTFILLPTQACSSDNQAGSSCGNRESIVSGSYVSLRD